MYQDAIDRKLFGIFCGTIRQDEKQRKYINSRMVAVTEMIKITTKKLVEMSDGERDALQEQIRSAVIRKVQEGETSQMVLLTERDGDYSASALMGWAVDESGKINIITRSVEGEL